MIWFPSPSGVAIDLLRPTAAQVDFAEIAHALAHTNRFAGNARTAISVAQHTLIGYDVLVQGRPPRPELVAHWLLHDAHEARLGDVTSPTKEAAHSVAAERYGPAIADMLAEVRRDLEARHDAAIHAAAGLPLPHDLARRALKEIDAVALATERRDFHARGTRPWAIDAAGVQPHSRAYKWRPPADVADQLLAHFRAHLPALRGSR